MHAAVWFNPFAIKFNKLRFAYTINIIGADLYKLGLVPGQSRPIGKRDAEGVRRGREWGGGIPLPSRLDV